MKFFVWLAFAFVAVVARAEVSFTVPEDHTGAGDNRRVVMDAVYHEQVLYIRLNDGTLEAWVEGAVEGEAVEAPGVVLSHCRLEEAYFIVTPDPLGNELAVYSGIPGQWALVGKSDWLGLTSGGGQLPVHMDCSGNTPLVMLPGWFWWPDEGGRAAKKLPLMGGDYVTTLQHGGFLYAGYNVGEWGGGLMRVPMGAGAAEAVDASDPQMGLCGGVLNKDCDPVTGISPDPGDDACVLVSVGPDPFR